MPVALRNIPVARVAEVCSIERQVDIFGEAADGVLTWNRHDFRT